MDTLKPSFRYRTRLYVLLTIAGVILLCTGIGLAWVFSADLDRAVQVNRALQIFIFVLLLCYLFSLWVANHYYRSLSYELHENEIILHRGFSTTSERYADLRAVAGVIVKRDLIDRWLEIGTLEFILVDSGNSKPGYLRLVGISDANEGYRKISSMLMNNWAEQLLQCNMTSEDQNMMIENSYDLVPCRPNSDNFLRRVP